MNMTRTPTRRRGLTLFELLLALAIFLASLAALAHLINSGSRAAIEGRLQTQAIVRCESKLAEVLAGVEPIERTSDTPFADDPDWTWSLEVQPGSVPDLIDLQVTVSHTGNSALANSSYSLRRYVRDPRLFSSRAVKEAVRSADAERTEKRSDAEQPSSTKDRD
jgi:general secretion pathway protein I